jgi:virulence-associated protein VagC
VENERFLKLCRFWLSSALKNDCTAKRFWYMRYMTTTLFLNGRSQAVRLPKEFRLPGTKVSIRRLGNGVLIEPLKEGAWPEGYFEAIRITDRSFARPDQGSLPAAPSLDA